MCPDIPPTLLRSWRSVLFWPIFGIWLLAQRRWTKGSGHVLHRIRCLPRQLASSVLEAWGCDSLNSSTPLMSRRCTATRQPKRLLSQSWGARTWSLWRTYSRGQMLCASAARSLLRRGALSPRTCLSSCCQPPCSSTLPMAESLMKMRWAGSSCKAAFGQVSMCLQRNRSPPTAPCAGCPQRHCLRLRTQAIRQWRVWTSALMPLSRTYLLSNWAGL
mmetsp:Transcript_115754/g.230766  ORF Transcript_115754/g.230766 Transcript_115754/m.230766 type:complete len:217 (+) Transcript_115754:636-1286(+)